MSLVDLRVYQARCDKGGDTCAEQTVVFAEDIWHAYTYLRGQDWRVDVYVDRTMTYCPSCKASVPEA